MDTGFSNVVRVLAMSNEESLIQFCEESGTIDSILGFRRSFDIGDSIIFLRFKRLSSIYDLKRRGKVVKLGGRAVLVETVADTPLLQEQCRKICKTSDVSVCQSSYGGLIRTPSGKENRRVSFPARPSSAPIGRFVSANALRLSSGRMPLEYPRYSPLKRLTPQEAALSKSFADTTPNAGNSTVPTIASFPSPLAKSPTVFKNSTKTNDFLTPRASARGPLVFGSSTFKNGQSRPLSLRRTLSLPRKTGLASTLHPAPVFQGDNSRSDSFFPFELDCLKIELEEAKEKYARSLEKVQSHLDLMEKKYSTHRV